MIGRRQRRLRRGLAGACPAAAALALALTPARAQSPVASPARFLDAFTTENWTVADGLPQSNVRNVNVGPAGYLWLTTPETISRFDGVRFEVVPAPPGFDPATSPLVAASLAPDGALWLHGYRKVWRCQGGQWDSLADDLFRARHDGDEDIVRLLHHADGSTWWLLRGGVVRWRPGEAMQEWLEPATPPVEKWLSDILIDQTGTVWVCGWDRLARIEDDSLRPLSTAGMFDQRPFGLRLAPRRNGGAWLYAATGLFLIDGTGARQVARFDNAPRAERLIEATDGSVWVAGDIGVHRWHHNRWSFLQPGQVPGVTRFTTLAESASGTLWLGGDGGLVCLRPRGYRLIEVPGSDLTAVRSPAAAWSDGAGETLIGIHDRIYRMQGAEKGITLLATVPGASRPGASVISALARDQQGKLWVGTGNEQLWCLDAGTWHHSITDGASPLPATGITCILPWPDQAPFIGSVNGLMRVTARNTLLPAHPSLPLDRVQCLARDPSRSGIWIGYESRGLVYFDPSPNQVSPTNSLEGLPGGRVNAVLTRPDGSLWISVGNHIVRWQEGKLVRFSRQHGLPPGEVGHLADDGEGGLWLANAGKLACVPLADLDAVQAGQRRTLRVRHHGHGLPADAVFNPVAGAAWRLPGARFAVAGGIIEARTSLLPSAAPRPDLHINSIASRGLVLANLNPLFPRPLPHPVHVPPGLSPIDISFTALDAGPPDYQQFRFRIRELDNDWTDLGNARTLSIPFLPPGHHHFDLAVRDANGEWVEADTEVALLVEARFWQTHWFLALAGLTGATLVFALTRWLIRRRYRRRRRHEEWLHHERSRIARDIHDDLGAGLTHLAMVARIAERDARQAPAAVLAGHLQEVFHEASAMVRSVDEIVWAVTPANDNLTSLVDYVVQYTQHFLRAADLACRVDLPESIPSWPVRSAVRHHVYMVVQEALNNIVKHAGATQVLLSAVVAAKRLTLAIADDGRGFDPALPRPADEPGGLQNFASRMAQAGGRFLLDTAPGKGTRVTFEIPLDHAIPPAARP